MKSEIRNLKSEIRNLKSEIRKIGNLHSLILMICFVTPLFFSFKKFTEPDPKALHKAELEYLTSCDRQDVDPCSYISNGAYAQSLQSVLNNLLANCPARDWDCNPSPCCTETKYYNLNRTFNGLNPWFFCRNRTDCYSYDCSTYPVSGGTLCNYGSIALQDSMLTYCRSLASTGRPHCACNTAVLGNVYTITILYGSYGI